MFKFTQARFDSYSALLGTVIIGLGLAFAVLYFRNHLSFSLPPGKGVDTERRLSSSSLQPKDMASSKDNFGYGDVRVTKILVHPIKSCRGTSVESSRYTPEGLEFDRRWAIIEADSRLMITAREFPKMVLITPTVHESENLLHISFPEDASSDCHPFSVPLRPSEEVLKAWERLTNLSMFNVFTMDGYICQSTSTSSSASQSLSAYFGRPVHLVYKAEGNASTPRPCRPSTNFPNLEATAVYQDLYPLLLFSEENVDAIEEETRKRVGTQEIEDKWKTEKVVLERFRPNIVLKGAGPFGEDGWEEISIGSPDAPRTLVVGKCTRCLLPNVSPETGEKDKAVPFKVIMKFRMGVDPNFKYKACVGSCGVPLEEGVVRVGDEIFVKKVLGR